MKGISSLGLLGLIIVIMVQLASGCVTNVFCANNLFMFLLSTVSTFSAKCQISCANGSITAKWYVSEAQGVACFNKTKIGQLRIVVVTCN